MEDVTFFPNNLGCSMGDSSAIAPTVTLLGPSLPLL